MYDVNDINYTTYSSREFCGLFDLLLTGSGRSSGSRLE